MKRQLGALCGVFLMSTAAVLAGEGWVDPVAFIKHPERFVGETVWLPAEIRPDKPFERDKALKGKGLQVVDYGILAVSSSDHAMGGDVVFVVEEDSAAAMDVEKLSQAPGAREKFQMRGSALLRVRLERRTRLIGGVLEATYYLATIGKAKAWDDACWHMVRSSWQRALEKGRDTYTLLLRFDGTAEQRYQVVPGYTVLNAGTSDQHATAVDLHPAGRTLLLAIPEGEASLKKLAEKVAGFAGFCRVKVKIKKASGAYNGKETTCGVALVQQVAPLLQGEPAGAEEVADNDGRVRKYVPFHQLTPSKRDVEDRFEKWRKALDRGQYTAVDKSDGKGKYRWREDGAWVYGEAPPGGEQQREAWERGKRRVSASSSHSWISGGYIYTQTYSGGTRIIRTWFRLLRDPATGAWERPDTESTKERLARLETDVLAILEKRNRYVDTILEVEERKRLEAIADTVEFWKKRLKQMETGGTADKPHTKRLIEDAKKRIAKETKTLAETRATYAKAIEEVRPLDEEYRMFLDEARAYAEGERELVGYEPGE